MNRPKKDGERGIELTAEPFKTDLSCDLKR